MLAALISAGGATAETPSASKDPQQIIREGAERILEGMRVLIDRIPQYAAPEMLPNGDIIIRRLPRGPNPPEPQAGGEGPFKL
ncbi:MAG: hypothetical protein HYR63_11795 [Proteobacteria bacterium]|nr:hypothetical protein [Pseudomonadota bacterium]MBI3499249.1 hypothetical protein [Pseudomonadota bacterium]